MKNIVFYGFQFKHHGKFSGFSALKNTLKKRGVRVIQANRPTLFSIRIFRKFRFMKLWMIAQEYRLFRFFHMKSSGVVHYFFPENSFFNAAKWKGNKKLVITCHQPAKSDFIKSLKRTNHPFMKGLKNADVVILMASNDIQAYQSLAPHAEVLCVPHGVDTKFFSKDNIHIEKEHSGNQKQVLTVGNWLRDYKFWAEVVKEVLKARDDIEFTVIAGENAQRKIREFFGTELPPNIRLLTGISNNALRNEYARANLLFLPLTDAWANNSLLEASSMAVPVMATNLPAVREYLGADLFFWFTNDSAHEVADKLINVVSDTDGLKHRGAALRSRMENEFSWEKIADCHIKLYEKLLES